MASSSSVSLMAASQTLILQTHTLLHPHKPPIITFPRLSPQFPSKPIQFSPKRTLVFASSSSSQTPTLNPNSPAETLLTGSTRTITTLFAIALNVLKLFTHKLTTLPLQQTFISTSATLFFATMSGRPARLHTPLTVVAAGMAKWLDIYSGVLLVRVLLSWFPNIPWDRQPLSAIRDLCDPYLNLFRNIIPPVFDTLDVSPLLAFAVLGFLAGILKNSRMGY
ncbi:ylmG homolog protein 1-2, chloroplastic-like [Bidens hawaiensis]|uniref:ylmG homolog protein 1-2, chloroplastic-like n=1 Tax=Bidens hawaiensis TaxID=980011 RepID=UPI004049EDA1